jgi:hypothetical protein
MTPTTVLAEIGDQRIYVQAILVDKRGTWQGREDYSCRGCLLAVKVSETLSQCVKATTCLTASTVVYAPAEASALEREEMPCVKVSG